jgi:polyhydroxybutyrate depolymerase
MIGTRERAYVLYRPEALARKAPVPLVVMLHGGLGSAEQAQASYGWNVEAAARGFVVVYPEGEDRTWNAGGGCCGPAAKRQIDDVGFLDALLDTVARDENIDPRRIYLTGMSNGGAMAYRYACERGDKIAAIGSVSGGMAYRCRAPKPVSVMEIHGTDDKSIPLNGGIGTKSRVRVNWNPAAETLKLFAAAASCTPPYVRSGAGRTYAMGSCALGREIALITLDGAGHQWPGGVARGPIAAKLLGVDPPSQIMTATTTLYTFFMSHSL